MNTVVFAHQGGWDEFLMVAGPLLFLSLVVWLAARRFKPAESQTLPADHNTEDAAEETFNRPREPFNNPRDPVEEPVP